LKVALEALVAPPYFQEMVEGAFDHLALAWAILRGY